VEEGSGCFRIKVRFFPFCPTNNPLLLLFFLLYQCGPSRLKRPARSNTETQTPFLFLPLRGQSTSSLKGADTDGRFFFARLHRRGFFSSSLAAKDFLLSQRRRRFPPSFRCLYHSFPPVSTVDTRFPSLRAKVRGGASSLSLPKSRKKNDSGDIPILFFPVLDMCVPLCERRQVSSPLFFAGSSPGRPPYSFFFPFLLLAVNAFLARSAELGLRNIAARRSVSPFSPLRARAPAPCFPRCNVSFKRVPTLPFSSPSFLPADPPSAGPFQTLKTVFSLFSG